MKPQDTFSCRTAWALQITLGLMVLFMILRPGFSGAQGLTEKEQLPIFLKVLSYDRTLINHPPASLHLGILFRPDIPASVAGERQMTAALAGRIDDRRPGLEWTHESVPWTSGEDLARKLTRAEFDIIYVAPGMESWIPEICRWTRQLDILTLAPGHEEVDLGLSLGLALDDDHPRIAVNITALREEGHELDSRILRLCKVVRE